jgi:hypothetical protein
MSSLESLVQDWLRLDQNEKTKKEIQDLWDTGNKDELEKRMRQITKPPRADARILT